jgi:hypothetical protein
MMGGFWQSRWSWSVTLLLGSLVGVLYYALVGFPRTPMTKARADRLFSQSVRPGQSREEIKAWLDSQNIGYDVLDRREEVIYKGWWMDCRGNQTVAECAGLDVDSVDSVIRVIHPDAARGLLSQTEVAVYLFFDSKGRLLRHWVDEFHYGL